MERMFFSYLDHFYLICFPTNSSFVFSIFSYSTHVSYLVLISSSLVASSFSSFFVITSAAHLSSFSLYISDLLFHISSLVSACFLFLFFIYIFLVARLFLFVLILSSSLCFPSSYFTLPSRKNCFPPYTV